LKFSPKKNLNKTKKHKKKKKKKSKSQAPKILKNQTRKKMLLKVRSKYKTKR